jgi:hypothetical protein
MFDVKIIKADGHDAAGTMDHDHFFSQSAAAMAKMPRAGLDFPFEPVCDDVALPHYDPLGGHWSPPKQPEAYVKITFVQLDDGTVWGDSKAVAMVMFQRTETIALLQSLKAAYTKGGVNALTQALSQNTPFFTSDRRSRFAKVYTARTTRQTEDQRYPSRSGYD